MAVTVFLDGKKVAELPAEEKVSDSLHLNPWSAGLAKNNMVVGWVKADMGSVSMGTHTLTIRAEGKSPSYKIDTKLMGGDAEKNTGVVGRGQGMRALQLDAFMITSK